MEHLHIPLEIKADEAGAIEGYGAIFEIRDQGGDVIAPGAFSASLASGRRVKMLFQHDSSSPIGVWNDVSEDERGLRVKGRILTSISAGRDAYELVKASAIDGLSIGYRTLKSEDERDGRRIIEAEVWEVSLVTFPMQPLSRIDAVKAAAMTERDMERRLTRDAGFSRSVALALMGGGYKAVTMRDAGDGLSELAAHMRRAIKL